MYVLEFTVYVPLYEMVNEEVKFLVSWTSEWLGTCAHKYMQAKPLATASEVTGSQWSGTLVHYSGTVLRTNQNHVPRVKQDVGT